MRGAVPASAREVFKNERRELSTGIMVKTIRLIEATLRPGLSDRPRLESGAVSAPP
jgi:hypothetical protein